MPEHILVTGGAGFIGSHIVDAFLEAGHSVAIADNLSTGKRANLNPAARFYETDIRDATALMDLFADERPTIVCHQAALADVRGSLRDPVGYAQTNIIGTLNLLEAGRAAGTVRRFLFASTGGAIYGEPAELPATESCPPHPLDPYGATKLAAEHMLFTYHHNYGLHVTILRYGNVYGPRQDPAGEAGVVAIFIGAMLAGRPATISGDGRQSRDFVYVYDVARANVCALDADIPGGFGIYNIGTGEPVDINTLFDHIAILTGYTQGRRHGPAKPGEVRHIYLDASRAARELGWQAEFSLGTGLAKTVEQFRAGR